MSRASAIPRVTPSAQLDQGSERLEHPRRLEACVNAFRWGRSAGVSGSPDRRQWSPQGGALGDMRQRAKPQIMAIDHCFANRGRQNAKTLARHPARCSQAGCRAELNSRSRRPNGARRKSHRYITAAPSSARPLPRERDDRPRRRCRFAAGHTLRDRAGDRARRRSWLPQPECDWHLRTGPGGFR